MVNITEQEYNELCRSQRLLDALRNHGVDNWEYFEDAYSEFLEAGENIEND